MVVLGEVFPNFDAMTNEGPVKFHDFIGDSWCILFSHPHDFTPVCTTELGEAARLAPEFGKRGVKMIALSCNTAEMHNRWINDIKAYAKLPEDFKFPFPIIDDHSRELSKLLGMLDPSEVDASGLPLSARACFVVGPDKQLKLSILYPATTGRDFTEIIRAIDSLLLTAKHRIATPVNWKVGDACMIHPRVTDEEQRVLFPDCKTYEMPSHKDYMRFTPQPE